jgi:hypothetical protein
LVEELRQPQPIPELWPRLVAADPTLPNDVTRWFDDRYGFRSVLIRLHNEIDYQLFRTSDRVLIGRNGYLFDKKSVDDVVADAGNAGLDQRIIASLRSLRDCLASRGIPLVFVLNATKSSIYPQFLPMALPLDPPPRLSRRLAAVLRSEPGIAFIDGEEILASHRDEDLFYKTDLHMNLKASAYVYRAMVAQIARAVGRPAPQFAPEQWQAAGRNDGSEERFLAKFLAVADISGGYATPEAASARQSDANGSYEWDVGHAGLAQRPDLPMFKSVFRNKRPATGLLPPLMLQGTSFTLGFSILKYNEAFAAVYETRSNVPERIGPLLRALPDDVKVFVLEYPEMFLSRIPRLDDACH